MKVEYTLTPEDYAASIRNGLRNRPASSRWLHYLLMGAVFLILLSQLAGFVARGAQVQVMAVAPLLLAALLFVFLPLVQRLVARRLMADAFRRGRIPVTSLTLEVRPEGLAVTTETTASLTIWEGIDRIEVSDTHAFFYLKKAGAQILPRRAFADERDFQEFVESARRYHEAAKPSCDVQQP
jgi:hypothetical protein